MAWIQIDGGLAWQHEDDDDKTRSIPIDRLCDQFPDRPQVAAWPSHYAVKTWMTKIVDIERLVQICCEACNTLDYDLSLAHATEKWQRTHL